MTQIAKVPRPEAYAAKLTKWIGYLKSEKTYLQQIGKALKAKDKYHAQKLAVRAQQQQQQSQQHGDQLPLQGVPDRLLEVHLS